MWLEILCGVVACEALVQLWFNAAPLQPIRRLIIKITPFLYSKNQRTHLLNCPYCISVWVGFLITVVLFTSNWCLYIVIALAIHRISNFLHLIFSWIRDKQLDLRVTRNKQ
jgi:hypothetical protein